MSGHYRRASAEDDERLADVAAAGDEGGQLTVIPISRRHEDVAEPPIAAFSDISR